ncbi:THUMP domain-containing protein 1 [Phytophthora pseudosyringae]|uniref:THUMP domain-containing protein 1 n=1 Tax=Phytophthora pseudosyringae TaxID=221518 RepID=A0A8T1WC65_9STRA|nr:THUMP domain-containing protein 1 [Phytophthora pseudosyringae]
MGRDGGGDKRKKQWMGGRDGNQKRHKGALGAAANAKGHGAVLVTCDKIKERQSVSDALNILNEAADRFFPAAEGESKDQEEAADDEGGDSVQKKLQEEIAALQTQAKKRQTGRFTALDTGVKGAILIQFKDGSVSPTALLSKMFEEVESSKDFASRFIQRMIPLEKVGYAGVDAIKELAAPMIKAHLEAFKEEQKAAGKDDEFEFAVEFKRRNCTNLNSMDVINALVELVGDDKTKVNLTTPRSVLMVEVFRNTCGFSILTDFHRYKKYNVRSIIDPPVPGQQTAKKGAKDGKTEKKDDAAKTDADTEKKEDAEEKPAETKEDKAAEEPKKE